MTSKITCLFYTVMISEYTIFPSNSFFSVSIKIIFQKHAFKRQYNHTYIQNKSLIFIKFYLSSMLGYLCQLFYSQQSRILQCTQRRVISCSHNRLTYIRLLLRTFFYIIWSSKSFQFVTVHPSGLPQGPSQGPPPGPSSGSCTGRCTWSSVLRGPETTVCAGILRHV